MNRGTVNVADCTISGNRALNGGGIYRDSVLTVRNCLITGNSASKGGGIYNTLGVADGDHS